MVSCVDRVLGTPENEESLVEDFVEDKCSLGKRMEQ